MKTWKRALKDAVVVGSFASLASLAGLAVRGRHDGGRHWAAMNAPSHWLWGDKALRQGEHTWRYTATGVAIHHLSAMLWGALHERYLGAADGQIQALPVRARDAALTTAVAAVVDFALVPHRFMPGFQRHLSPRSLAAVYGLFGLGLMAGSYVAGRCR